MTAIEIKDLKFSYGNIQVFDGLDFTVEKGSFMTVLGSGGSGKSTLFKILYGSVNYDGNILFLNKSLNYAVEKGYAGFISLECDYIKGKVIDELAAVLKLKGRTLDKIKIELQRMVKKLGIGDLLYFNYNDLSVSQKVLVMFAYQFLFKPRVLILDNVIDYLDDEKKIIIRELIRFNKRGTVINITNNTEESLYGRELFIIGDGYYDVALMEEDDFVRNGLNVPFMLSLSNRLRSYELIDKNYFDVEKLVDVLWE